MSSRPGFWQFHEMWVSGGPHASCRYLGQKGSGRTQRDHRSVSDGEVLFSDSTSWQEIPMILMALVSTASSSASCEAGVPAQRGEQYSIKLQMKPLYVDWSSGVPRKNFVQQRMPSMRLALEGNFEMWFAKSKSWLRVRPRSLSD